MRIKNLLTMLALSLAVPSLAFADSNATGGGVVNSESIFLGAGPFDHGSGLGSPLNTVASMGTFTGGFTANYLRIQGTLTAVNTATWGSEADIQVRSDSLLNPFSFTWENPGPGAAFTTFDYDSAQLLTTAVDPGTFTFGFDVEFFDTFEDDAAGPDSQSSNVTISFEELVAVSDTDGVFDLGSVSLGDQAGSVGEFALEGLFDLYSINLTENGELSFFTGEDLGGFVGSTVDTEIAIFDSAGTLIAEDDDGGEGTYSGIFDLALTAGDYTIAVSSFDSTFADGPTVTAGTGIGDYSLNVSFSVPEPTSFALLGLGGLAMVIRRRRNA